MHATDFKRALDTADTLRAMLDAERQEATELRLQLDALKLDRLNLETRVTELRREIDHAHAERQTAIEETTRVQGLLTERARDSSARAAYAQQALDELKRATDENTRLQQEAADADGDFAEQQAETVRAWTAYDEQKAENTRLRDEHATEVQRWDGERAKHQNVCNALQAALAENTRLREALAAVQSALQPRHADGKPARHDDCEGCEHYCGAWCDDCVELARAAVRAALGEPPPASDNASFRQLCPDGDGRECGDVECGNCRGGGLP